MGMANVERIAETCPERLEAMVFGVADYAASVQARTTRMGGANPDYGVLADPGDSGARAFHWGDQWHFAMSRMIVACRANGLRPIDGPYGTFAALGGEGKWAIHPSQIALANQVFTPGKKEVTRARRILEELEKARAGGRGAVSLDGRMIDAASIRQAEMLIGKVEQIGASGKG